MGEFALVQLAISFAPLTSERNDIWVAGEETQIYFILSFHEFFHILQYAFSLCLQFFISEMQISISRIMKFM